VRKILNNMSVLIILISVGGVLKAQKINIRNVNGKRVEKASVVVQVNYKATDYIFHADKEKLFTAITDSTGIVELTGEFQRDDFEVKSLEIKIKHTDYSDYNIITLDYSNDPKYSYNVYLSPKNKDVNVKSLPGEGGNGLDVFSSAEVARKLKVKEEEIIAMIERGELRGKKIGDKYFVSGNEIKKYLEE
jgi:excisionase family DNA binding protein